MCSCSNSEIHLPVEKLFGKRLRSLRLARKMTQQQLSNYLGIDRSHISHIELGRTNITLNLLNVIAEGFKMPLSKLLRDV